MLSPRNELHAAGTVPKNLIDVITKEKEKVKGSCKEKLYECFLDQIHHRCQILMH
mgnify:CR=1 FL=1